MLFLFLQGIVKDILACSFQVLVIPNNVVIVAALPKMLRASRSLDFVIV